MAVFNPSPNPTNDPEYLRYSKEPDRIKGDTSTGAMLEGLGNLVGPGIKGLDLGIQDALKKNARDIIEPIRDAHGASVTPDEAPAIAGTGSRSAKYDTLGTLGPEDSQAPVPKGFERNVSGLKRMTDAYQQGEMSDTHYYSELNAAVSTLRARFPGYEEQIDNAVKDITGIIPANALRASVLRDMNSLQAAAGAKDKENQSWLNQNEKYIYTVRPGWGKDQIFADRARIEVEIGDMQAKDYQMEVKGKRLDLSKKLDDHTKTQYGELATDRLNTIVSRTFNTANNVLQRSGADIYNEITKMGNTPDPVKMQTLSNDLSRLEQQIGSALDAELNGPVVPGSSRSFAAVLGPEAAKARREAALQPIRDMQAMVGNKNPGLANAANNIIANREKMDQIDLGNRVPVTRALSAMRSMVGEQLTAVVAQETRALPQLLNAAVTSSVYGQTAAGTQNPKSLDKVLTDISMTNDGRPVDGKTQRATLNSFFAMTDAKDPIVAGNAVKVLYSDPKFFIGLPDDQKMRVFQKMASPEFTKKIDALEQKVPGTKDMYTQWVERAFGATFYQGISDAQDAIDYNRLNVRFNPETWRFNGNIKDFEASKKAYPNAVDPTNTYFTKINQGMAIMKPVLEAQYGKDEALGRMFTIMQQRGLNLNSEAEGGTIDKLAKVISESLGGLDFVSGTLGMPKKKSGNLTDNPIMNIKVDEIPTGMDAREYIKMLQQGK